MYETGSLVMHESAGVCRIDDIQEVSGMTGDYYVLTPLYLKGSTLFTPVSTDKVKIRPVMTQDAAEELVTHLPETEPFRFENPRDYKQQCSDILKSGDIWQIARLAKTIRNQQENRRRSGKRVTSADTTSTMLKRTELLLFGELATALHIDFDCVPGYIAKQVES